MMVITFVNVNKISEIAWRFIAASHQRKQRQAQ